MAATKKQVGELENAIVILEERLEKLEEEHVMMKQMIGMQNALIDNLQMMVKMLSSNTSSHTQLGYVHLGGANQTHHENKEDENKTNTQDLTKDMKQDVQAQHLLKRHLKHRMLRVV